MKSTFRKRKLSTAISAVLLSTIIAVPTMAQKKSDIEKITVTTQKRVQTLKEVPVAVSAFNEDFIEKANIENVKDLVDYTPGLHGKVTNDSFFDTTGIRGIVTSDYGVGGDLSIGLYQDGVYQGRNGGALGSFFDVSRVEVARGPQGTLFGRNAASGAINVITNKPEADDFGKVSMTLGTDGLFSVEGMYNKELSDDLFFRVGYYHDQEDNYITNQVTDNPLRDRNIDALRASFLYTGIENGEIRFTVNMEDREMDAGIYKEVSLGGDFHSIASDLGKDSIDAANIFSAVLDIEKDLGPVTLTSQTAFKSYEWDYVEDYDGTAMGYGNYAEFDKSDYFSHEFRISSNDEDSNIYWFVGASVYREDIKSEFYNEYDEDAFCGFLSVDEEDFAPGEINDCHEFYVYAWDSVEYEGDEPTAAEIQAAVDAEEIPAPGDGTDNYRERVFAKGEYSGWAVFGDLTWSVNEQLDITFGARYTEDTKDFTLNLPNDDGWLGHYWLVGFHTGGQDLREEQTWSEFTPRLAANYKLNDDVSIYANYSNGYKSGGYNTFAFDIPIKDWTGWSEEDEYYDYEPDGVIDQTDEDYLSDELWAGSVLSADLFGSTLASFDPETVDSYEIGLKGDFLDNKIKINAALYYYDYNDFQYPFTRGGGILIQNIGKAEGKGLELEVTADVTEDFQVYASYAHQNTEVLDGKDVSGAGLAGLNLEGPENTFTFVGTYNWTVSGTDMYARGVYSWQDDDFGPNQVGVGNEDLDDPRVVMQEAYGLLNLYVGASWDEFNVNAFITNATDKEYYQGYAIDTGINRFGIGKPRQIGVSMSYSF